MTTEKGIVIRVDAETAWVKTIRTGTCETCAQRQGCHVSGNGRDMEVEAINAIHAAVGDRVVLSVQTASLLKTAFLLYVFPILSMLAGAIIGQETAPLFDVDPSGFSAIIGLFFFSAAFLIIRKKGTRLAERDDYRPRIIKITG